MDAQDIKKEGTNESLYDLTVILTDEVTSERVEKILQSQGVINLETRPLSNIRLAYPIQKRDAVFLGVFTFTADPKMVSKIEKELRMADGVLRLLILKTTRRYKEEVVREGVEHGIAPERHVRRDDKETPFLSNEALEKKIEEILR